MAKEAGVSQSSVSRTRPRNDLKPRRTKSFKLSNDKDFERKYRDVIGLYLDPAEKSVVLRCDEKTRCQALERTQPGLPLRVGHVQTRTHDYYRLGTIRLFAAMSYLEGKLICRTEKKHAHLEWLRFLKQISRGCQKTWTYTWLPTTTARTGTAKRRPGWASTSASTCISRPLRVRG